MPERDIGRSSLLRTSARKIQASRSRFRPLQEAQISVEQISVDCCRPTWSLWNQLCHASVTARDLREERFERLKSHFRSLNEIADDLKQKMYLHWAVVMQQGPVQASASGRNPRRDVGLAGDCTPPLPATKVSGFRVMARRTQELPSLDAPTPLIEPTPLRSRFAGHFFMMS